MSVLYLSQRVGCWASISQLGGKMSYRYPLSLFSRNSPGTLHAILHDLGLTLEDLRRRR